MRERPLRTGPVADREALLMSVRATMQRFTAADVAARADERRVPVSALASGSGVFCPSCERVSAGRPTYLGLELCPHCGSAMPRRRNAGRDPQRVRA